MAQTSVEWLVNELENNCLISYRSDDYVLFKKLLEQAKEMEKEQRMYSEKEVLQLLLRLQQTESYDNLYDWFEQFKKK